MTDSPNLMNALNTQMRYMAQRQNVLAQNMANIDTPGYKARDLKKLDFGKMMDMESTKLAMTTTAPQHLSNPGGGNPQTYETRYTNPDVYEYSPTHNSVVLEQEMVKVSETNTKFEESTNLMKKYTQMLHEAASSK